MHYKEERDGKKRNFEKEGKKKTLAASFSFTKYTWSSSRCIQSLKTQAPLQAENSVTEFFVREKETWKNKATDKQYVADSLLHSTICHTQPLHQIS